MALKMAREEIRSTGKEHPFYWAPFILIGDAGSTGPAWINTTQQTATASLGRGMQTTKDIEPLEVKLAVAEHKDAYRSGDKVSIQLSANRDCNVYVFDIGADGASNLIFPNRYQPSDRVEKDRTYSIPSKESPVVFRLDGPEGRNYIKGTGKHQNPSKQPLRDPTSLL